jgi:hypothetical protein
MRSIGDNLHIINLPVTPELGSKQTNPEIIAKEWLGNLESILLERGFSRLSDCFHHGSWWRDMLALDWEFHTIKEIEGIRLFFEDRQPLSQLSNLHLVKKESLNPPQRDSLGLPPCSPSIYRREEARVCFI